MAVDDTFPPPAPKPVTARYKPGLQKRHAPLSNTCMNGLQDYEQAALAVAVEEKAYLLRLRNGSLTS